MNVKLVNRKEELFSLVKESFKPKMNPEHYGGYMYRPPSSYASGKHIYFYEWSNPDSTPLKFYSVDAFACFLNSHDIKIETWEREVIQRMIYDAHVACRKNTKNLVVASSQQQLKHVLTYGHIVIGGR